MLSAHKLGFNINNVEIFSDFSFQLTSSTITYLQGSNGSGKTSLLRMIAGIQKPSSGKITYGKKAIDVDLLAKPYCLYIGHNIALKNELSVLENMQFWARFYDSIETVDAAIYYFNLGNILHKKCHELSAGNKQKLALTRLLTCKSDLWLLDEVDQNLDHSNKNILDNLIKTKANSGGLVILTTHETPRIKNANSINMNTL